MLARQQQVRMQVARIIRGSIVTVFLVGCSQEGSLGPPDGFSHAAITRSCGPTDGAAVTIYLSATPVESLELPAPYVRLAIFRPLDALVGRSWSLAGDDSEGAGWFHPTTTTYELVSTGTVRVTSVADDSTVEGTVDVRFPGTGRIRGGFTAPWIHSTALCG